MRSNILNEYDLNDVLANYIDYLQNNEYAAMEAELFGLPIILVAAKPLDDDDENVQPMFIIPSDELVLHIKDPESGDTVFGLANTQ